MTLWFRATAGASNGSSPIDLLIIEGTGRPGLAAVDELARWMLDEAREGRRLSVEYLAPELADLLDLAGLNLPASNDDCWSDPSSEC